MHIVFGIVGHIIVDDHGDIVDINSSGHDVCSYKHVELTALELEHDVVAGSLVKVGVHFTAVDMLALKSPCNLFHFQLTATEDDDTLEIAILEDVFNDAHLLRFIAYIGTLLDLFCGFADSQFNDFRVLEQCLCKVFNLIRHRCREHNGLASLWKFLSNLNDIIRETHVEHTVGFIEDEERNLAQVHVSQADM